MKFLNLPVSALLIIILLTIIGSSCKKTSSAIDKAPIDNTISHNLILGTWHSVSKVPDYPEKYFGPNNFYYEDIGNPYGPSFHLSSYYWGTNDTLIIGPVKVKVMKLTSDSLVYAFDTHSKSIYRYYNKHLPFIDSSGNLSAISGADYPGYGGDGGSAEKAQINGPAGLAIDKSGNIYFFDGGNACMREITAIDKTIYTIAGQAFTAGGINFGDDNLPALSTRLNSYSYSVTIDKYNNIYFLQYDVTDFNNVLYKLSSADHKCHIICGKLKGYSGDGGAASKAATTWMGSMISDSEGNIYISDQLATRIRKISASDGTISAFAGNGTAGYDGDGGDAKNASIAVGAMALDNEGNLLLANDNDLHSGYIRKINFKTGIITTIAGTGKNAYAGDGVDARQASFTVISSIIVNKKGDIFISETSNSSNRIRKITALTNIIKTIAGNKYPTYSGGGNYLTLKSFSPTVIAFDPNENLIISDYFNNKIFKITYN
ncbi:NHL domain-containing protein [Mucilaginibacter ginsenosidivorax]|uniref:Teneurin NHL domain-containing protein n=1 Tax=Mucilaginibacter ginsenosidivorax TaxID=862126 RepID=A0A5B8W3E6_9SPHI|nr:hypothetical protein [Mucilaginibacter ginsenosidivorax]QEC78243.1 hypothetical protein FSB76_20705 [Mucilaginibacter ginsenosidivorax]